MSIIIKRTRIIGTDRIVFTAWAPVSDLDGPTTTAHVDGVRFGKIGTDPDRSPFYHLPAGSKELIAAVAAAYRARYDAAYAAILAEHPEAAGGRMSFGEITITVGG